MRRTIDHWLNGYCESFDRTKKEKRMEHGIVYRVCKVAAFCFHKAQLTGRTAVLHY